MLIGKSHTVEDSLLLVKLGQGSEEAFEVIYEKYWSNVFDEAYKRIGDRDLAKDIAQEVFTSMWTRGTETPIENLPAWLYTVTKNHVYKVIQKQERFVPLPDLLTELESYNDRADAVIIEKELLRAYETLIESLPDQQRIIFRMRFQDELSPDEIALKLELSPKTIRNHLGRAILKLKTTFMLFQLLMILAEK
ncbi:MAG: sigma-70 family RNA polymerase sigma factor [Pedobacter sp.]|jgi:RNA polymerase sigma-70 factor (ECF subfamily)